MARVHLDVGNRFFFNQTVRHLLGIPAPDLCGQGQLAAVAIFVMNREQQRRWHPTHVLEVYEVEKVSGLNRTIEGTLLPVFELVVVLHALVAIFVAHREAVVIAVEVFEFLVTRLTRHDALGLDRTTRWREVQRGGEFDGAGLRNRHHGLHRPLAKTAFAQHRRPVAILQCTGDDF